MLTNNQRFLYQNVVTELRTRIASGKYPYGTAIPSLSELVKSFDVSPITIRRALHELMFEGILYGRQGRGVFVADTRPIVRVLTGNVGSSLGDEIRRAGFVPSIAEVAFTHALPDADLKWRLRLRGKASLYRHEKLIFADGVPIALDIVHLPSKLAEQMRERLRDEFVFPLMSTFGIEVGSVTFRFSSALASDREASLLNVSSRFPLIVARYILFDKGSAPVLEGYTVSRADRMTYELTTEPHRVAAAKSRKPVRQLSTRYRKPGG